MAKKQHIWLLSRELHYVEDKNQTILMGSHPLGYFPGTGKGYLNGLSKAKQMAFDYATRRGGTLKDYNCGDEYRAWSDPRPKIGGDYQVFVLRRVYRKVSG